MKYLDCLIILLLPLVVMSQGNNFDGYDDLYIQIEENSLNDVWQIGVPQKTFFNAAKSPPNAIVTDTVNTYPANSITSFTIELLSWGFPYIQLSWLQKTDMEDGIDGGIIEASYDYGNTWLNVFNDPVYRPIVVGTYKWDTLYNGQAGITGKSDWNWTAICWGSDVGTPPEVYSSILIKFTFIADSNDTKQEGWMIDNFFLETGVIGNTPNLSNVQSIKAFPSPTQKSIFIDVSDIILTDGKIDVYNSIGLQIFSKPITMANFNEIELDLAPYPSGMYHVLLKTNESIYHQKITKIE